MKTNSINNNGCSVCETGKENYTTFRPAHRPKQTLYQYDYRHTDGELFTTVALTLSECRSRRDEWLNKKEKMTNYNQLKHNNMKGIKVIYTPEQFKEKGFDGEVAKYMRENKNTAIVGHQLGVDSHVISYSNIEALAKYCKNNPYTKNALKHKRDDTK